jgi:hypothetical protein
VHGIADVLAFDAITLLAGHISHVLAPTCVLNVSEPQAVQAFAGPEKPTSQAHWSLPVAATLFAGHERHALMLVDARVAENRLLGHATHALEPLTLLYVPSGHFSHQSGQILVSTSVPCTCISFMVTWLAIELRTYR